MKEEAPCGKQKFHICQERCDSWVVLKNQRSLEVMFWIWNVNTKNDQSCFLPPGLAIAGLSSNRQLTSAPVEHILDYRLKTINDQVIRQLSLSLSVTFFLWSFLLNFYIMANNEGTFPCEIIWHLWLILLYSWLLK